MARRKRNEVLVGGVALLGFLLFLLLLFLMGSLDRFLRPTTVVHAVFRNVQSLQSGDAVFLFGMRAGKVEDVRLLPRQGAEPARIQVAMRVPREYRSFLREDTQVRVDKSLTGNISVLVEEGEGRPLPPGASLTGTETADVSAVFNRADFLLKQLESTIASVSSIVETVEREGNVSSTLKSVSQLVEDVRKDWGPLRESLHGALDAARTLISDNSLDVRETVDRLKVLVAQAKDLVRDLKETPRKLDASLDAMRDAGSSIIGLVRDNRARVDAAVEDLSTTAANASSLTADIKRRPWLIFHKPSLEELEELQLYDAALAYTTGASELYRSLRALGNLLERSSGGDPPAGGQEAELLDSALARVRESLERQRQAEELFWKRLSSTE